MEGKHHANHCIRSEGVTLTAPESCITSYATVTATVTPTVTVADTVQTKSLKSLGKLATAFYYNSVTVVLE